MRHVSTAYYWWVTLGLIGVHHLYLGRIGWFVLYLFTFGLLGCGWISDLFLIPTYVKRTNNQLSIPLNQRIQLKKYINEAYVLWFPFGILGFHYFYIQRWTWGILYFCTFGLLGCGWLMDGFFLSSMINDYNLQHNSNEGDSQEDRRKINESIERNRSIQNMYKLWFPLGLFGLHHFYVGNHFRGWIYLLTFGLFGCGWIIDGFFISEIYEHSQTLKKDINGTVDKYTLVETYQMYFPLGFLGLHHFYLGRKNWGIFYLCTLGGFIFGWLIDCCLIPSYVKEANRLEKLTRPPVVLNAALGYVPPMANVYVVQEGYSYPTSIAQPIVQPTPVYAPAPAPSYPNSQQPIYYVPAVPTNSSTYEPNYSSYYPSYNQAVAPIEPSAPSAPHPSTDNESVCSSGPINHLTPSYQSVPGGAPIYKNPFSGPPT